MRRSLSALVSLLLTLVLLELGVRAVFFQNKAPDPSGLHQLVRTLRKQVPVWFGGAVGEELNRRAWEASYRERGLEVPPDGPREGYWGARLDPKNERCPPLLYCESERSLPGLVSIDARGLQHAGPADAPRRLLLLGGSVAFGAYASRSDATYFARLAELLAERGLPTSISVLAAGSWVSDDEVAAFVHRGAETRPDVVVFLDGLNDLTIPEHLTPSRRAATFARNMATALEIARLRGVRVVFALQPWPEEKPRKTPIEERLIYLSFAKHRELPAEERRLRYAEMRNALAALADGAPEAGFIDCSRALDGETTTTFSDYWHFSDPGHALLARCLADGLAPILASDAGAQRG